MWLECRCGSRFDFLSRTPGALADGAVTYRACADFLDRGVAIERRHVDLPAGAVTGERVAIAGRVRANRNGGMFIDLHDMSGKIQVFSHKDFLAPDQLAIVKLLDLGDLIGVEGIVRRTPRGELTINAERVVVLAKALLPLPEKFHGLADLETRYRQRYLDLIMNPESRETLRRRSRIIGAMPVRVTVISRPLSPWLAMPAGNFRSCS